jgi:UDP-GlcNAc:undecaprenyl-phosphate GlcNAc-1-phosphate transferase
MISPNLIIQTMLVTVIASLLVAWVSMQIARRAGLIDYPYSASHKTHKQPTPLAGGIAFVIAMAICSIWAGSLQDITLRNILITGLIVFVLGLLDDAFVIAARWKLLGQVAAAIMLYVMGISVGIFDSPEFLVYLQPPWSTYLNFTITLLWLVGITNAFNFVDSMDGLAVGLGGMAAAFFCLLTMVSGQASLAILFAVLLGVCISLYYYNSAPALFFLGDSGSQSLGFVLAALAIVYQPVDANQSSSWFAPILLLGVPIFDATLVVLSRLRRGTPVYQSALDHTYHRLIKAGLAPNRAVLSMQGVAFLLGGLAFICLYLPPLQANLIFSGVLLASLICLVVLDRKSFWR